MMPCSAIFATSSRKCHGSNTTPLPMTRERPAHHARRQQRELVGLAVDDERVPGIVPALKPHDDIGALGQPVDDLALALVAPLGADHGHVCHGAIPLVRHAGLDPASTYSRTVRLRRHGPRIKPGVTGLSFGEQSNLAVGQNMRAQLRLGRIARLQRGDGHPAFAAQFRRERRIGAERQEQPAPLSVCTRCRRSHRCRARSRSRLPRRRPRARSYSCRRARSRRARRRRTSRSRARSDIRTRAARSGRASARRGRARASATCHSPSSRLVSAPPASNAHSRSCAASNGPAASISGR